MKKITSLLLLCLSTCLLAQEKVPFDKNIKTGQLDNGLKYFILENQKPEDKIELRLFVNAGSILEDDDQQGLAHLMEHMCFNGLEHFPHNELVEYLQSIGVKFGADLNAYTSFEETVYILPIPSDKREKVEQGFQILADWSGGVLLDSIEIDKERGVVLEESRTRKGANDRMMKKWLPELMNNSLYSRRLPIGIDSIIEHFPHCVLKRFYKDWYRPNLQAVAVVGDIEADDAEALIKKYFSKYKNPENPRKRVEDHQIKPFTESKTMVVTDDEASYTFIGIAGSPSKVVLDGTVAQYREKLAQALFNNMLNERLKELTKKPNPPFFAGNISLASGWSRNYKGFMANIVCGPENIEKATQAFITESMRAKKYGFLESEFKRIKASVLNSFEKLYSERDKRQSGQLISEIKRHFLTNESVPGIEWEYNYIKDNLDNITLEEVNAFRKKINIDENYFAFVTTKTADNNPTQSQLKTYIDNALKQDVEAYTEEAIAASLLEKEPTPGKIVFTKKNEKLGTTTWTLNNGAKVTIKKTDFKNDEIILRAERFGGYSLYEGEDFISGEYSNNVVDAMGFGKFSVTDLSKFMKGKIASANAFFSTYRDGINGSSRMKDLETMMQLIYLKTQYPRADEDGFKSFISKQIQSVQSSKNNPRTCFFDSLNKVKYNNHPKNSRLHDEADFEKLNMNNALEFYKDRFETFNGFHFIIVGNVDEETLKPLVQKYIASVPKKEINLKYSDLKIRKVNGVMEFSLKKGQEKQALIYDDYYEEKPYEEVDKYKLLLLKNVINNKVIEVIREEMSAIYGGGINMRHSQYPYQLFSYSTYFPCAPENIDKIRVAFDKILKEVQTSEGIDESDLTQAKQPTLQSFKESLKKNNFWMMGLSKKYLMDENPESILEFSEKIDAVTKEELVEVAKKYLSTKNVLRATWMPEEK